jgi:hypothetical protein
MPATLAAASTIARSSSQVSCQLTGEELAILNTESGVYYGLDPIGARIWELIESPTTIAKLRNTLLSEYEVDLHTCERDLLRLLQDLASHDLIEVRDDEAD